MWRWWLIYNTHASNVVTFTHPTEIVAPRRSTPHRSSTKEIELFMLILKRLKRLPNCLNNLFSHSTISGDGGQSVVLCGYREVTADSAHGTRQQIVVVAAVAVAAPAIPLYSYPGLSHSSRVPNHISLKDDAITMYRPLLT